MLRICLLLITALISFQASAHGSCYKARIVAPATFQGNSDEMVQLFDGSVWIIKVAYENMNLQYPMATICPKKNLMIVKGTKFYVKPIND